MVRVIKPEELEKYSPPRHYDILNRQMVGRPMGAEKMSVALERVSPGGWAEIHSHDNSEHCHYILKGEVIVTMPNIQAAAADGLKRQLAGLRKTAFSEVS